MKIGAEEKQHCQLIIKPLQHQLFKPQHCVDNQKGECYCGDGSEDYNWRFIRCRTTFVKSHNHSCSCGSTFAICRTIHAAAEALLQFTEPFVQLRKRFCNLQNHSCSCGSTFAICRTSRAAAEILLQFAKPLVQLRKCFRNLQSLSCSCGNAFVSRQTTPC